MASLRDVADRAGVSLATASRVASGSTAVRPETRQRVEGAMRDLLYVPPGRIETTSAIGLFVPEFSNPVFAALAEAMEMHAARSGLATILCNTHGSAGRERDYVRMLLERGVEGMVFISAEITDVRGRHSHYAKLLERGTRLVFVNGGSEDLDVTSVGVDERAAGRIATEHLIELGHERIGFVAGHEFALPTREKTLGHRDALRAAQLRNGLVSHSAFTVSGGREALAQLLALPEAERPTGVICSS
ncbi:MAG TPA: LacI family DNA-binding transcriptional regulator, partial [Gaiellaceae bacterium]|nr:LacI family DNA-binding transcriptional regulator [Gaiellaceae bacterium]